MINDRAALAQLPGQRWWGVADQPWQKFPMLAALLMKQNNEYAIQRRYVRLESLASGGYFPHSIWPTPPSAR